MDLQTYTDIDIMSTGYMAKKSVCCFHVTERARFCTPIKLLLPLLQQLKFNSFLFQRMELFKRWITLAQFCSVSFN